MGAQIGVTENEEMDFWGFSSYVIVRVKEANEGGWCTGGEIKKVRVEGNNKRGA